MSPMIIANIAPTRSPVVPIFCLKLLFLGIVVYEDRSNMTIFAFDVVGQLIQNIKALWPLQMESAFLSCWIPIHMLFSIVISLELGFDLAFRSFITPPVLASGGETQTHYIIMQIHSVSTFVGGSSVSCHCSTRVVQPRMQWSADYKLVKDDHLCPNQVEPR